MPKPLPSHLNSLKVLLDYKLDFAFKNFTLDESWGKAAINKKDVIIHSKRHPEISHGKIPIIRMETIFHNTKIHNYIEYGKNL
jgi:hypothetical protein